MNILIVDDSLVVRRLVKEELLAGGFSFFEAPNGQTALEILETEAIDLMTLDWMMPGMDGAEVCRRVRRKEQDSGILCPLPIIFLTSKDTAETRAEGFEAGALNFIVKPFLPGELLSAVRSILNPPENLKGKKVALVAAMGNFRQVVASALRESGMEVSEFPSLDEVIPPMKSQRNIFDIILTAQDVQGKDSQEFCRWVRKDLQDPHLPLLLLAPSADRAPVLAFFKSGGTDYLPSPFLKEELLARLEVHLAQSLAVRQQRENLDRMKRYFRLQEDFLAVTTHDLLSPLNSIMCFSELLRTEKLVAEQGREYLEFILEAGRHLTHLVSDIMELARIQSDHDVMDLQELDLCRVVDKAAGLFGKTAALKGIELQVRRLDREVGFLGDSTVLLRILSNLLSNAIKFTEKGGRVLLNLDPTAQEIRITVADNGIGMDSEALQGLFDRFSKVSRTGTGGEKGTGLGMFITRELVQRLGGKLEITSRVGEGSVFTLVLPPNPDGVCGE